MSTSDLALFVKNFKLYMNLEATDDNNDEYGSALLLTW